MRKFFRILTTWALVIALAASMLTVVPRTAAAETAIPEGSITFFDSDAYTVTAGKTLTISAMTQFPDMSGVDPSLYEDGLITLDKGFDNDILLSLKYNDTPIGALTLSAGDTSFWVSEFNGITPRQPLNVQTSGAENTITIDAEIPADESGKTVTAAISAVAAGIDNFDTEDRTILASDTAAVTIQGLLSSYEFCAGTIPDIQAGGTAVQVPVTLRAVQPHGSLGYDKALVKVEVAGPGAPDSIQLLASDTEGHQFDVAQTGYWGPPSGFPIGNDYNETTDFTAKVSTAGNYTVTLKLVDMNNGEAVITQTDIDITASQSAIWVDDSFTAADGNNFTLPGGSLVKMGTNAFTSVQDAVKAAQNGDTVKVFPGEYGLDPDPAWMAGGQGGWYLPIVQDNLTLQGVDESGNPISGKPDKDTALPLIYGEGFTANGSWASQDLVAVFGDNATISGFAFMPKSEPNKTIELIGANPAVRYCRFEPTTKTDVSDIDGVDYSSYGGSLYLNGGSVTNSDILIEDNYFFKSNITFDSADFTGGATISGNTMDTPMWYVYGGTTYTFSMIGTTTWETPAETDLCDVLIKDNEFINIPAGYKKVVLNRMDGEFILQGNFIEGDDANRVTYDMLAYGCTEGSIYLDTIEDDAGATVELHVRIGAPIAAEGLVVDDGWAGKANGSYVFYGDSYAVIGTNAFANIQDAVKTVAAGQTIKVFPGRYPVVYSAYAGSSWYLYIEEDDVTIMGVDESGEPITGRPGKTTELPIIYGDGNTGNGAWGTQTLMIVTGDDFTLQGLEVMPKITLNKDIEISGDNSVIRYCRLSGNSINPGAKADWGGDWDVTQDNGALYYNTDAVIKYTVDNNYLLNTCVSINNGAGLSGSVSDRSITNNIFDSFATDIYNPEPVYKWTYYAIGFRGKDDCGWRNEDVGEATISGNTFVNCDPYGSLDNAVGGVYILSTGKNEGGASHALQLDWDNIIAGNTFNNGRGNAVAYVKGSTSLIKTIPQGIDTIALTSAISAAAARAEGGDTVVLDIGSLVFESSKSNITGLLGSDGMDVYLDKGTVPSAISAKLDAFAANDVLYNGAAFSFALDGNLVNYDGTESDIGATGENMKVTVKLSAEEAASAGDFSRTGLVYYDAAGDSFNAIPFTFDAAEKTLIFDSKYLTAYALVTYTADRSFKLEPDGVDPAAIVDTGIGVPTAQPGAADYNLLTGTLYAISGKAVNETGEALGGSRATTISVTSTAAPTSENFRMFHWADKGLDGHSAGLWTPVPLAWTDKGDGRYEAVLQPNALNYGEPLDPGESTDGPFAFSIENAAVVSVSSVIKDGSTVLSNELKQTITVNPEQGQSFLLVSADVNEAAKNAEVGSLGTADAQPAGTSFEMQTGKLYAISGKAVNMTAGALAGVRYSAITFMGMDAPDEDNFKVFQWAEKGADGHSAGLWLPVSLTWTPSGLYRYTASVDGALNYGEPMVMGDATDGPFAFASYIPGTASVKSVIKDGSGNILSAELNQTITFQANANNKLESLTATAGTLDPEFEADKTDYSLTLDKNTGTTTLTAVPQSPVATVYVNGIKRNTITVDLLPGQSRTVWVLVVAQSVYSPSQAYSIEVEREKDSNTDLASLSSTAGAFDKPFDPAAADYTLTLDKATSSTELEAAAAGYMASLKIDGITINSKIVALTCGASQEVVFQVTAQDGSTKEYTVTVLREKDDNTRLASLSSSAGTFDKPFDPETYVYALALSKETENVSITASAESAYAALTIDGTAAGSKSFTLANGETKTVIVQVTAQSGSVKDYIINIRRAEYAAIRFVTQDALGNIYPGIGLKVFSNAELTNQAASGISDSVGVFTVTGLQTAAYWVKVTSVPAGYYLSQNVVTTADAVEDTTTECIVTLDKTSAVKSYKSWQLKDIISSTGVLYPAFNPDTMKYTLTLDESTKKTTITPVLASSTSRLYISGHLVTSRTISLNPGSKYTISIKVHPRSGSSHTYYVTVVRKKSTNANLSNITASRGVFDPITFNKDITTYHLNLVNTQSSTYITPTVAGYHASYSLKLDGKHTHSRTVSLRPDQTRTLVITVKPQTGPSKTYTVIIYRAVSHNNNLSKLTTSRGTLSPEFNKDTTEYTLKLTHSQSYVRLYPTVADGTAEYSIRSNGYRSSRTIYLSRGQTKKVQITVTAQSGEKKVYTIYISREK